MADLQDVLGAIGEAVGDPARLAELTEQALEHRGIRQTPQLVPLLHMLHGRGLRTSPRGNRERNLEQAIAALKKSCDAYEWQGDQRGLAGALHELGLAWEMRVAGDKGRNLEESIACHRRSLRLHRDGESKAMAEYELGRRYLARNEFATAKPHFANAAQGYGRTGRADRSVDALEMLARCHDGLGERPEAIARYDEAIKTGGEGWRGWVDAARRLGELLTDAGDHERALAVLRRVHAVLERTRGEPHVRAGVEHALGAVYNSRERGDRAENIELAIRHLEASLRLLDPSRAPSDVAVTHQQLAAAYDYRLAGDRRANLDKALEHLAEALSHLDKSREPNRWAMTLQSRAVIHFKRKGDGDLEQARECLRQVLTVRTPERDPAGHARARELLGMIEIEQNEPSGAGTLSGVVASSDAERDPVGWAASRVIMEEALRRQADQDGEPRWAERAGLLAEALTIYSPADRPRLCIGVAQRLGMALAALERWAEAAQAFATSIEAAEMLQPDALTVISHRTHGRESDATPRLAAYCLARAGRLTEAVVTLERGRARIVGDALDRDHARLDRLRGSHPALHRRFRAAVERVDRLRTADRGEDEAIAATAGHLRVARDALDAVVRRVRQVPGYEQFLRPVDDVIRVDEPIAYLIPTDWGSVVLVVTRSSVRPIWVADFDQGDLTTLLHRSASAESIFPFFGGFLRLLYGIVETRFADGASALTSGDIWADPGAVKNAGRTELGRVDQACRLLIGPLVPVLREIGAEQVVLVPCGALGSLPLHTAAYDTFGHCLVEEFTVSFVPSARVLRHARERAAATWPAPSLAAVSNPLPHPSPLRYTDAEVAAAAGQFPTATVMTGTGATKQALIRAAASATHLHLACHAQVPFASAAPSRLDLAGGDRLTLDEISGERLFPKARLVVLSACQSALVDPLGTPDEAIGLASAVLISGVPGVIGALWPVDDLSTALLMRRFYELLLGESLEPAQALGRAQCWLAGLSGAEAAALLPGSSIDASQERPFQDRYYWAAFVFIGR